ncbi:hypothetical protein BDF14DRAFT_1878435 [Spinellus fusiger]|nr:hypothetical protein BDF14DRAFT_1878435 [Spinellus fusiger]
MVAKKRKTATESEATTAVATTSKANEEVNFPRGGASALTPVEYREISNKVASDLFSTSEQKSEDEPAKKKLKADKKKKTKSTAATAAAQSKDKKKRVVINELSFKKLTVGTLLLGSISRINDLELVVALPHQLVGTVAITDISETMSAYVEKVANQNEDEEETLSLPDLHSLFHVGQWVRCRITTLQDRTNKLVKKRIELSMKPEVVNADLHKLDVVPGTALSASVDSVEDHGYVLSLGVKGLTGFCKSVDAKSFIESRGGNELMPGQIVECVVRAKPGSKRTVEVELKDTGLENDSITEPFSRITSVTPGQLVTGTIEEVVSTGLTVKLMGLYETTVDASHLPLSGDINKQYSVGAKINYRILYCILNTEQKTIAGSVLPHILSLSSPVLNKGEASAYPGITFPTGSFLDVRVVRITHSGVNVSIPALQNVTGFVHISRLADEHIKSVSGSSGKFQIGSEHRARVLGYNPTDAIFQLTLQPSILNEKYMSIDDVQVGSMVVCTALKLVASGLLVNVTKKIVGLVPTHHLSDVHLTHPETKFKSGMNLKARVLLAEDGERRRVILTLKNSLTKTDLPIITSLEQAKVGEATHGVIVSIKKAGCIIGFFNNVTAFAPASEMTETTTQALDTIFRIGQTVKVNFIDVNLEAKKLIVSCINTKRTTKKKEVVAPSTDVLKPGEKTTAQVKECKRTQVNITLPNGMEGRVHLTEMFKSIDEIKNRKHPTRSLHLTELEVRVLGLRDVKLHTYLPISNTSRVKQTIDCSLLEESHAPRFVSTRNQLRVSIGGHLSGIIRKQHTSSNIATANSFEKHFIIGEAIEVAALFVNVAKSIIELIHVDSPSTPTTLDYDTIEGKVVQGCVRTIDPVRGLLVQLTSQLAGKVCLTDLSDKYIENPTQHFKEGDVLQCAVVGVDANKKRIALSLRHSLVSPETATTVENKEIKTTDDLKADDVVYGYVENISDSGVFLQYGRHVNARVKIANLSDAFIKEWKSIFTTGQLVKSKLLSVEADKKVEASLKQSVVEGTPVAAKKSKKTKVVSEQVTKEAEDNDSDEDEIMKEAEKDDSEEDDSEEDEDEDEEEVEVEDEDEEMEDASEEETPVLAVSGFDWTGQAAAKLEAESDSEEEAEEQKSKKKNKKSAVEDKTAELSTTAPQVASDYERLLVGSPNSSYLWINYMAYQLQLSEIAKAREIGERALKTISFREEQEKLNVWVAMLNLENNFGSEDTLNELFKRALAYCEPKKIYLQLIKIYERSDKHDKADALWIEATKKFSQSSKVWTLYGLFCLQRNEVEKARELFQKSLKSLPKHKHIKTISKFALMEFKHGEPERGRTIFEGLMSSHPKRVDLWSVYLDMEIRADDQGLIRRLFERVTSLKFSSKKMKFFFKKWLQYERENGSEDDVERVKEKALSYVENKSTSSL